MTGDKKRFYFDLIERTVWTFIQALVGTWLALGADLNLDVLKAAAIAAGLAVVKGVAATQIGSPDTAATLPFKDDTPNEG